MKGKMTAILAGVVLMTTGAILPVSSAVSSLNNQSVTKDQQTIAIFRRRGRHFLNEKQQAPQVAIFRRRGRYFLNERQQTALSIRPGKIYGLTNSKPLM